MRKMYKSLKNFETGIWTIQSGQISTICTLLRRPEPALFKRKEIKIGLECSGNLVLARFLFGFITRKRCELDPQMSVFHKLYRVQGICTPKLSLAAPRAGILWTGEENLH